MADPSTRQKSSPDFKSDVADPPSSSPVETSFPSKTRRKQAFSRETFYISVPVLSDAAKAVYRPFSDDYIPENDEFPGTFFYSIIGEYREGPQLFYFAKTSKETQAFKVPSERLQSKQPDLVEQYIQRTKDGILDSSTFDPQADYIHPSSRVRLKLSLSAPRTGLSAKILSSPSSTDDSYRSQSSDDELEDESYSDPVLNPRGRTRRTAGPHQESSGSLPFSPKTTRSGVRRFIYEESDHTFPVSARLRRSTRSRRSLHEADGDRTKSLVQKVPRKRRTRGADARPAYGHVRGILTLDDDSDEDTQPLRSHRGFCEKCHREPTNRLLLAAAKGTRKRGRKSEDEDEGDDKLRLSALGGWVQCQKCPVSAHWGCLARTQRDEILRAILDRERTEWRSKFAVSHPEHGEVLGDTLDLEPSRRSTLDPEFVTEFICGSCMKGGFCLVCQEKVLEPDSRMGTTNSVHDTSANSMTPAADVPMNSNNAGDVSMKDETLIQLSQATALSARQELLFRCFTCKRLAHYAHLPIPDPDHEIDSVSLAIHYQSVTKWQCADCYSFIYDVDQIIAWRPFPAQAVEPVPVADSSFSYKLPLPREYLVKWQGRSYRRLQWVPHAWLLATNPAKLKNFVAGSRPFELLAEPVVDDAMDNLMPANSPELLEHTDEDVDRRKNLVAKLNVDAPTPDAEQRIPHTWKTVDRVLDVLLWRPQKMYRDMNKQRNRKKKAVARRVNIEDDELDGGDKVLAERDYDDIFTNGEEPHSDLVETVKDFEQRTGRKLCSDDAERVVWSFMKWNDLGYDNATWDTPPRRSERSYALFQRAFDRFLVSREIVVPVRSSTEIGILLARGKKPCPRELIFSESTQPQLGQIDGLKLMPFQVTGVNWLCDNWWKLQHCILADEMGLGKTVQIVTFLGVVTFRGAYPALVVVPNSTITNWVREFERWAPWLRVCSFYGDAKSRDIIKQYELYHKERDPKTTGAKYHVLVTTFETVTNAKEFGPVFKQTPRWEVLVVDEGQRLKSDTSLIFKRLGELNTTHRIILTGTPLNNNIRELFNLMNFLDSQQWADLELLSKEYEELTEDRIKELHVRLRPYFLRRVKSEVLQLPPKNEVIVPVSMTPLQKEIYRSILSQNAALLRSLSQGLRTTNVNTVVKNVRTNMNNILMELRKCLQHPYLISRDIEPTGLSPTDAHEKLIDASAKLRLLKALLPRLKARGHRVLLFSQFSIGLNILEDFLIGEQVKYLRLDGNTKQADRQKGMDEFNKPNSDVFIYLLTTRAGGVGINLWTADTVIIFDPDFNPHQDLQAIARAHRFGQRKTCLVFKLMVKNSAEERIMQTGKKKLVLDHLIVQKMEDGDSKEDVQSILLFGAQTLFEDGETQSSHDINYTDHDIDTLIERTEMQGDHQEDNGKDGSIFSFAKVWAADRERLEEMGDGADNALQADSWAQTLQRLADEMTKEREQEATGRGVRRRAAAVFPVQQQTHLGDTPAKKDKKKKGKKIRSHATIDRDSDAYAASVHASDDDSDSNASVADDDFIPSVIHPQKGKHPLLSIPNAAPSSTIRPQKGEHALPNGMTEPAPLSPIPDAPDLPRPPFKKAKAKAHVCGLCGAAHSDNTCFMTESAQNLAEFRNILLSHAGDETIEERRAAIAIIDETLYKRGQLHLIFGQPLHLVENPPDADSRPLKSRHPVPPPSTSSSNASTSKSSTSVPTAALSMTTPRPDAYNVSANIRPSSKSALAEPNDFGRSLKKEKKQRVVNITTPLHPPPYPASDIPASMPATRTGSTQITSIASRPKLQPDFHVSLGSGKRPASPSLAPYPPKKLKTLPCCHICSGLYHLAKDCPLVRKGSQSIQREIGRLESDPANEMIVQTLQSLLKKYQAQEQLAASGTGVSGRAGS